jgi:hypothetical protein
LKLGFENENGFFGPEEKPTFPKVARRDERGLLGEDPLADE